MLLQIQNTIIIDSRDVAKIGVGNQAPEVGKKKKNYVVKMVFVCFRYYELFACM